MNPPPNFRAIAIDFESTGSVPGYANEPWQIGLVPIEGRELGTARFESLLRVGPRPFNRYAPGRHAVLRHEIAAAPSFHELGPQLLPRLTGTYLVAHHAGTERTLLAHAAPLHVFGPWIDTLVLARKAWPGLPSYELNALIEQFGLLDCVQAVCPGREAHDALYDAVACGLLFLFLWRQPGWDVLEPDELVELSRH